MCSLKKQAQSTLYFCGKRNVCLCIANCFEKWHTLVNLWVARHSSGGGGGGGTICNNIVLFYYNYIITDHIKNDIYSRFLQSCSEYTNPYNPHLWYLSCILHVSFIYFIYILYFNVLGRIMETKGCMDSTSFTYNIILVYLPVAWYSETVSVTGAVQGNCSSSSVNDNYSCVERQLLLCQMTITPWCSGCWIRLLQLKFTGRFWT